MAVIVSASGKNNDIVGSKMYGRHLNIPQQRTCAAASSSSNIRIKVTGEHDFVEHWFGHGRFLSLQKHCCLRCVGVQAGGTLARCVAQGRGVRRSGHVPGGCRNSCHRKHTAPCPLLSSSQPISDFVNSVVALNVSNCLRH